MDKFEQCFHQLLGNEGKYSNHPADPGGETMWGITKGVARMAGYHGEMRELPLATAKEIYRRHYWADWMANAEMPLCFELFDASVNCGQSTAAKLFQRALGVKEDCIVGPRTMAAASAISTARMWVQFAATVLEYRASLPQRDFGKGWVNRSVCNLRKGAAML